MRFFITLMLCIFSFGIMAQYDSLRAPIKAEDSLLFRIPDSSNFIRIGGDNYTDKDEYDYRLDSTIKVPDDFRIIIPVVVHVLYNKDEENISMEQIESQLKVLNNDFNRPDTSVIPKPFKPLAAECGIYFVLANRDPEGNKTDGVIRVHVDSNYVVVDSIVKDEPHGTSPIWDSKYYLNIWVCKLGDRYAFSSAPWGTKRDDGVVVDFKNFGTIGTAEYPRHLGRTLTHEVGHWLGLFHIWGSDSPLGKHDDYVDDTPIQYRANYYCKDFPHSPNKLKPHGEMFMNFMDYSDDDCLSMFTWGQRELMIKTIYKYRPTLFDSNGYKNLFLFFRKKVRF